MSGQEYKLFDTTGKFTLAVKNNRELNNVSWNKCRILISNKRIILASGDNKKVIPLSNITNIGGRSDVNQSIAAVSNYISVEIKNENVLLISTQSFEDFELSLYKALIDEVTILSKHPAVEGGVITDEKWTKAKQKVDSNGISLAFKDGKFVEVTHKNISNVEKIERDVKQKERIVISVSHAIDDTSVETYIAAGNERTIKFIYSYLKKGEEQSDSNIELGPDEKEVLMGIYSGVSPFEIPEFTGLDIDKVEDIYDKLIEQNILDEIRVRREVSLTSRGRNLASESMNDE